MLLSSPRNRAEAGRNIIVVDLKRLLAKKLLHVPDPRLDLAFAALGVFVADGTNTSTIRLIDCCTSRETTPSGVRYLLPEETKDFEAVGVSNDVFILGFPAAVTALPENHFNYQLPLLRKGIVAGKDDRNQTIVLDCFADRGNSGGPVVEVEQTAPGQYSYKIIGLVERIMVAKALDGDSLRVVASGYSVAVSMNLIRDLAKAFSKVPELSN
jgi:hypothetical protein